MTGAHNDGIFWQRGLQGQGNFQFWQLEASVLFDLSLASVLFDLSLVLVRRTRRTGFKANSDSE